MCVAYVAVLAGDGFGVGHEKNEAREWRAGVSRRRDGKDKMALSKSAS